MSWSGFVKAVNRTTATLLQTTGAIDKTVDASFDAEAARLATLRARLDRLLRDARALLDALAALSAAHVRAAEALEPFYADVAFPADALPAGPALAAALRRLEFERAEADREVRAALVAPLEGLGSLLSDLEAGVDKRGRKLLDFDAARTRARKALEKEGLSEAAAAEAVDAFLQEGGTGSPLASPPPSPVPGSPPPPPSAGKLSKTQAQLAQAFQAYAKWNGLLLAELPRIFALRAPYADPGLGAAVEAVRLFAAASAAVLQRVADGEQDDFAAIEAEMGDLAICAGKP
ncbi:BAR domain-containing protein [Hyaloraphidium curvatum]|nr:BAR domain-containing protein [Hyaloraphidium curvatum]